MLYWPETGDYWPWDMGQRLTAGNRWGLGIPRLQCLGDYALKARQGVGDVLRSSTHASTRQSDLQQGSTMFS